MSIITETMVRAGRLTVEQRSAAVNEVRTLEQELFGDGRGRSPANREAARFLVEELNELRSRLGWLSVDADGRWQWPAFIDFQRSPALS